MTLELLIGGVDQKNRLHSPVEAFIGRRRSSAPLQAGTLTAAFMNPTAPNWTAATPVELKVHGMTVWQGTIGTAAHKEHVTGRIITGVRALGPARNIQRSGWADPEALSGTAAQLWAAVVDPAGLDIEVPSNTRSAPDFVCVFSDTTVADATRLMEDAEIGMLFEDGEGLKVISHDDLSSGRSADLIVPDTVYEVDARGEVPFGVVNETLGNWGTPAEPVRTNRPGYLFRESAAVSTAVSRWPSAVAAGSSSTANFVTVRPISGSVTTTLSSGTAAGGGSTSSFGPIPTYNYRWAPESDGTRRYLLATVHDLNVTVTLSNSNRTITWTYSGTLVARYVRYRSHFPPDGSFTLVSGTSNRTIRREQTAWYLLNQPPNINSVTLVDDASIDLYGRQSRDTRPIFWGSTGAWESWSQRYQSLSSSPKTEGYMRVRVTPNNVAHLRPGKFIQVGSLPVVVTSVRYVAEVASFIMADVGYVDRGVWTIPGAPPPSILQESFNSGGNIIIAWSSVPEAVNYQVEVRHEDGDWEVERDVTTSTSFVFRATPGDTYMFRVRSRGDGSSFSAEPGPPTDPLTIVAA